MVVHPVVASVVGQVTDNRWGQVLQTPHAYGVVEMFSPVGNARERGVAILTELTNAFDVPPVSLSELAVVADRIVGDDVMSLILLVPVGMTLYIVSRGTGRVYLKRGTKLAMLVDASQSLAGDVSVGDVLIAATSGFVHTLSSEEIVGVFDHLTPIEVAEKLTMRLHEKEGGEGGAALIFQVGEVPPVTEPEQKVAEEILAHAAPVAQPIALRRAKEIGRRVTSVRQRMAIRKVSA